jgi:hypothetical protein
MHVQTLEFMFKISPTYFFIQERLNKKLKEFFKYRKTIEDIHNKKN